MNIAFICNTLHGGGAERFTANIANQFCKEDDVYVITGAKADNDYSIDLRIVRLDFLTKNILKDYKLILKEIKNKKIDVIVGIDIYPNFCVCLCSLFTKARCIISERNAPKQVSISKKSRLLRWLLYRFADGYVFQTNGAKDCYSKKIQKKSVVIHNPIREDLPKKTNANRKEIVAVGRLNAQKNYPMLLKAFSIVYKKHSNWILRIFGEGEMKPFLSNLCNELGISNAVKFEGFTLNVHESIKNSSIFVMTSDYEGMPNALMEAMAMGFPVISTDCPSGGPGELISNGENGLLCEIGNAEDCARKICQFIEDKDFMEKNSKSAIQLLKNHNSNYIMKKWRDFLYVE